jgi:two-component system, response regulator YesN
MLFNLIIADDELSVRNGFSQLVDWEKLGFNLVGVYDDGDAVIEHLKKELVNVVLSDILMQRVTGLDIAKYVQEHGLSTVVVLISAHSEFDLAQNAIEYGVKNYLLKPTNLNQINTYFNQLRGELVSAQYADNQIHNTNYMKIKLLFFEEIIKNHLYQDNYFNEEVNIEIAWENVDELLLYRLHIMDADYGKEAHSILNKSLGRLQDVWADAFRSQDDDLYVLVLREKKSKPVIGKIRNCFDAVNQFINLSLETSNRSIFSNYRDFITFIEESQKNQTETRNLNDEHEVLAFIDEHIRRNITGKITIEEIAELVHKNSSYLGRFFKKHKKVNFVDYVNRLRVEKAREMLLESEMYIYDIGKAAGYANLKYFYKIFKKLTGVSPTEYRKRNDV